MLGLVAWLVLGAIASVHAAPVPAPPAAGAGAAAAAAAAEPAARPATMPAPPPPPPSVFAPALAPDVDVALFPRERRPAPRPTVVLATRVAATPPAIAAVVTDPGAYRRALPSLVRAEVVSTAASGARLVAWELEVPLVNLEGKAWLTRLGDVVDLQLAEGAFAPGRVRFRWSGIPDAAGARGGTALTCEVQIDARSGGWLMRRVARHDPWAEAAVTAAAGYVLMRAVALLAEAVEQAPVPPLKAPATKGAKPAPATAARPGGPIGAPPAASLDAAALVSPAVRALRAAGTPALVRRAPGGRLGYATVAVPVAAGPARIAPLFERPEIWQAFPGWKKVTKRPPPPDARAGAPVRYEVDDGIAFVDFDAVWQLDASPLRATAVGGATRGAVFGWDALEGGAPGLSLAALSMHPRLDAAGFVERRLIAAEPLLEHALALALTYVDASAAAEALSGAAAADAGIKR
jgi:hypothetical protein